MLCDNLLSCALILSSVVTSHKAIEKLDFTIKTLGFKVINIVSDVKF